MMLLPMAASPLPERVAASYEASHHKLSGQKALVGFDGFVDTILHVVDKRESPTSYTRMGSMTQFAERIAAAAGLSANLELVTLMVKLGGNGPIMANALEAAGIPLTYIGNLGYPNIHPVFVDFSERVQVHSIAEPGYTDAVEFNDGKLMFGKHESLKQVNWDNLIAHVPVDKLSACFAEASLIALVNWTMLTRLDSILSKCLTEVAPGLTGEKRWLFFDLADPAKRTEDDIAKVLETISDFGKYFRVVLGLNLPESRQIGEVLGLRPPDEMPEQVSRHAGEIHEKIGIDTVVIHPTAFAAAADATGVASVKGPYAANPKITTGAGDHFNAGFCVGRVLGFDLESSLQTGVATSGYYVREAKSPTAEQLVGFLRSL
jgi:hypothetical protein